MILPGGGLHHPAIVADLEAGAIQPDLLGVGKAEGVVLTLLLEFRVAILAGEKALEGVVDVAQRLDQAMVRDLLHPRRRRLEILDLGVLRHPRNHSSPPTEGPTLLQGEIIENAATAGRLREQLTLFGGGVETDADGNVTFHTYDDNSGDS